MLAFLPLIGKAVMDDDQLAASLDAHLREWGRISDRLRTQLAPALQNIQGAIQQLCETTQGAGQALQSIASAQNVWAQLIESFPKIEIPRMDLVLEGVQGTLQRLPPEMQDALLVLADHGWYLDAHMTPRQLWSLKNALSSGSVREAEHALIGYFHTRCDQIER
jgi:hypothetical protein